MASVLHPGESRDSLSKVFDICLGALILINVLAIVLESVEHIGTRWSSHFQLFELVSLIVFSLEYVARIWSVVDSNDQARYGHGVWGRVRYARSPMAIIDLITVAPLWLSLFIPLDLRVLRVIRLLRILKLTRFSSAITLLYEVIQEEIAAISAAMFMLFLLLILAASGTYLVEHTSQPEAFGNIPQALWWGVITVTTVGYGDVVPVTPVGKFLGALLGLIGVVMVALPAGIMASGFSNAVHRRQARFSKSVDQVLDDGVIDANEKRMLKAHGVSMNLSEETINNLIQDRVACYEETNRYCPHCLKKLS